MVIYGVTFGVVAVVANRVIVDFVTAATLGQDLIVMQSCVGLFHRYHHVVKA